jgi:hypothetical protein
MSGLLKMMGMMIKYFGILEKMVLIWTNLRVRPQAMGIEAKLKI